MRSYQHPLTEQALIDAGFLPIRHMPYPLYEYNQDETYTNLYFSYQDGEYIFSEGNPLVDSKSEYYRGPIDSMDELTQLLKKLAGNGRAKTELGRELQDADFVSTPSEELIDGILLAGASMRWYKISKSNQTYKVEFDRNRSGFEHPTDVVGTYASLFEAVRAAYNL